MYPTLVDFRKLRVVDLKNDPKLSFDPAPIYIDTRKITDRMVNKPRKYHERNV